MVDEDKQPNRCKAGSGREGIRDRSGSEKPAPALRPLAAFSVGMVEHGTPQDGTN